MPRRTQLPWVLALLAALCQPACAETDVPFSRDIRPLLSAKCFHCHGPDDTDRQADLRLDNAEDALGSDVIVPHKPDESLLWERIATDDPDLIMPPPDSKMELTSADKKLLYRWIEQGAQFASHWAFEPPRRPAISATNKAKSSTVRNPIDAFVQAELKQHGLQPAAEADRRTLIRRATFDLWGLPPTPAEVTAFVNDPRPDAYEHLLDRLFASPRYGERMTVAWMDIARYGDTSVFHADGPRDMWPWRDWVLRAYNNNMPFDQFTVEQLAGDLLPEPTTEQMVATGFHRNHGTTDEGGAIDEEYRVEYIVDRVRTTSMVWMGMTLECGQCHDHKYDPFPQRDYYRLYAYFNQTPEKGMQTRNGNAEPRVMVPNTAQSNQLEELQQRRTNAEQAFTALKPPAELVNDWARGRREGQVKVEWGRWHRLGPLKAENVDKAFKKKFGPEKKVTLDKKQAGQQWQAVDDKDGTVINFPYSGGGDTTYLYRTVEINEPTNLNVALGSDDTIQVWLNGKEVLKNKASRAVAADQEAVSLSLPAGSSQLLIKICNGGGPTGYYFRAGDTRLPEQLQAIVQLTAEQRDAAQQEKLAEHFKRQVWQTGKDALQAIEDLKQQRTKLTETVPTVMVMREQTKPRMTYVLNRGAYDSPDKQRPVTPGTPDFLPSFESDQQPNRLGLARWLTNPRHPLTARVAVNRYWAQLFGRGIVSTVTDFGSQGAWPSHPELLDYLATEFVASGWDVKAMLRHIMSSHTYRQSSNVTAQHQAIDPINTLLARAPRLRLPAEFIRDNALSLAGLLVEQVGGPGVRPYQPPGLWNEVSLSGNVRFVQDHGQKLYRRTMYTYWKRSSPQPAMLTFDVPTREKCVVQRQRTNTPLQALVTLNDVQFVEAARGFAQRILTSSTDSTSARLDLALQLATARPADAMRRATLSALLTEERQYYRQHPDAAKQLLAVGEAARNDQLAPDEFAAWTVVASVILNLDEALNKE